MIPDLKPYPTMKDSGVVWIGDVPDHWDVVPNRSLMRLRKELVGMASGNFLLLSLTKRGVIPRDMENPEGKFPTTFYNYQVIEPGNLIFCLFDIDETPRAVGLSSLAGMVTGAYTRFECSDPVMQEYIYRFYLAMDDRKCLKPLYTGLRKVITKSAFLSVKMPLPSLPEQTAIARYLNNIDRRIRRYIRDKQKLIKLLEEQKQAIIHRAVTRGLNPNVRFKPSGIEWLGNVPEHWNTNKLKFIKKPTANSFVDGPFGSNLKSEHYVSDGDIYVVESGFITSGQFVFKEFKTITKSHFETIKRSECSGGDIIIAKIGARYGTAGVLPTLCKRAVVSGNSLKLTVNEFIAYNYYIHAALLTARALGALESIVNVTAQPALSLGTLNNLALPLPPLSEQIEIISAVRKESERFEVIIKTAHHQISLCREYRTRLMADVVTGKLDVREAAAHLPEEAEVPENIDTVDELADAENDSDNINFDNGAEEAEE